MSRLPIVAAIPNYNMGQHLGEMLPAVLDAGYDDIFVLDDASTDGSREVVRSINEDIHFIAGTENKGAGGNRNRILSALGNEATVHFIDADCRLDTKRAAEVVADIVPASEYGFVGGLVLAKSGLQHTWNYGARQSLWGTIGSQVQGLTERYLTSDPAKADMIRQRFPRLLADWPDPLAVPKRRQVFWAVEGNMIVNSQTFAKSGGFDETLREHEIHDLSIRMAAKGLQRFFDPSVVVTHQEGDVRQYNRLAAMIKTEARIARKHGYRHWLLPNGKLIPEL